MHVNAKVYGQRNVLKLKPHQKYTHAHNQLLNTHHLY